MPKKKLAAKITDTDRIDAIMDFWFGDLQKADLPGSQNTTLWFGGSKEIDGQIKALFAKDLESAILGKYDHWVETPRGTLALIILFDQFSRNIYRSQAAAFAQDDKALTLCLNGIKQQQDHTLTLIQRVFFYMPLEHSEKIERQEQSVSAFQTLASISMPETAGVYQAFLKYAFMHYDVIKQFGRFPHRNAVLARNSTEAELLFLAQTND